jgi:hypothetical protein
MTALKMMKAHCPTCDSMTNCDIHGQTKKEWEFDDGIHSICGANEHKLLECRGCNTVFYFKLSTDDLNYVHRYIHGNMTHSEPEEFIITFPLPEKDDIRPSWFENLYYKDHQLHTIMDEMYTAYTCKSFILASIALRTTFDRVIYILSIDPALTFKEKLDELVKNNMVLEKEKENLAVIVEAGNAAAHRGWSPTEKTFKSLLAVMEDFVRRAIFPDENLSPVRKEIPVKPKRIKQGRVNNGIQDQPDKGE